ncbi:hypothetical protein LTR92_000076 [Exophiala xenobiotica]|nr:hypothetical protein LTR92_000076 [Exophiala xenobiotica]
MFQDPSPTRFPRVDMNTTRFNQLDWPTLYATLTTFVLAALHHPNAPFIILFIFRYLRLLVHIFAFVWLYKPTPIPGAGTRTITERDVTVIIPTVEPGNPDFAEYLASVLANHPRTIHVVTVGRELLAQARVIIRPFALAHPHTDIHITTTGVANKRRQVAHILLHVRTAITLLVDDHVFWPSPRFLATAIAPFENPSVGAVGTNKRVRREDTSSFGFRSFWNVMGCLYLERHNFEIRATNSLDGGVFVISGRTCAYRTCILQSPQFLKGYLHERFLKGMFGPLNADDDNYITRAVVAGGWKIKIQYSDDAMIETTLGTYPKFLSQCLRWARTTWRSNPASLRDCHVWRTQPWCVYAVYLTSFVNFALLYDALLFYTLGRTTFAAASADTGAGVQAWKVLALWIFASKMVKLVSYFTRHPKDLVYLPGYICFAYLHSLIKLYALLTFWVTAWGGRDLDSISRSASPETKTEIEAGSSVLQHEAAKPRWRDGENFALPADDDHVRSWSSGVSTASSTGSYNNEKGTGGRRQIVTPWGYVSPESQHLPANVLLDQRAGVNSSRRPKTLRSWQDTTKQSHGDADDTFDHTAMGDVEEQQNVQQQLDLPMSENDALALFEAYDVRDISPLTLADGESCYFQDQDLPHSHSHSHPVVEHLPTPPASPPSRPVKPSTSGRRVRIDPYARAWSRADCGRLHYNGSRMAFGEMCALEEDRFDYWLWF